NRALSNIQGFTDALQLQGFETYSRVLEVAEQQADTALLEGLGIDATTEATQVIRIRRLRYVDGLPAAILTTLVRADLGTRMQRYRLEEVSFFDLYQEILGQRVSRSEATLQVTLADAECQALMGVEAGSPHFRYSARNYLEDSTPVEVVHGVFRGDMFHFRTVVVTVGEESPFIVATDS
ncbi:MAG: UTRA domain-containing protein, partial [Anaerolineae bacterium]|nr:UTRA domain-containing protein [Anaerolineae bacterium]